MNEQEIAKLKKILCDRWQKVCGHIGSWDEDDHNAEESRDEWTDIIWSVGAEDCEPGDGELKPDGCVDIGSPYFDNNIVRIPIEVAKKILALGLP